MTADFRSWSGPARAMALAVDAAIVAAQAGDADAFTNALHDLGRGDREQLSMLLGAMTRDLIERSHLDGIDGIDAEQVVHGCIRAAKGWYQPLDRDVLIRALTDALGVSDPDDSAPVDAEAVLVHGLLLIADRLTLLAERPAAAVDTALRELLRAQTVEMP